MKKILVAIVFLLSMAGGTVAQMCHVPYGFREENWIGVDEEGDTGGSCGWASSIMALRCCGQYELAEYYRRNYGGGTWGRTLIDAAEHCRLRFDYTRNGDREWMMWAINNRLPVATWYYPGHAIVVVGLIGGNIIIMDCNEIDAYRTVPVEEFFQLWKHEYGGFGICFIYQPLPPWPTK